MKTNLLNETIDLLNASELSYQEISKGAGVKESWLRKLADGVWKDPGVNKIERLRDFLVDSFYDY